MGIYDSFMAAIRRGRPPKEPPRQTVVFPVMRQGMRSVSGPKKSSVKPTPRNLRQFARNPYARRAINSIKNPVSMLSWEICPKEGLEMNSELERQIELARFCLEHPNGDDDMRTLLEQVVEDYLMGAGAVEIQKGGDAERPVWLYPVDGLSIQIYADWNGGGPRYAQVVSAGAGTSPKTVDLTNEELMYIRPNPTTANPFGLGALEVAFTTVSRILGVAEFAGNVATNSRPSIGLDLGDGADTGTLDAFRYYWRNEVEGQGNMPIFAMGGLGGSDKARGPSVLRFYPEGDDGLYLKYQEFLQREIAASFDISPQNLGIERDVNRSTSETSSDRDTDQAVAPTANAIQAHFTKDILHSTLGFTQLRFRFKGIDSDDEMGLAKQFEVDYRNNAMTPNEYRKSRGWLPSKNPFSDLLQADVDIAIAKAKGEAAAESSATKPKPKDK